MDSNRLRVFVSSKMEELAEERAVIKSSLDELKLNAFVFEKDAGARSQSIQKSYQQELGDADLYIGLFWKGYGEYTIDEFKYAQDHGIDCLIYEKRNDIESNRDPALDKFLNELNRVQSGLTIQRFSDSGQLGELVKRDVAAWQTGIVRRQKNANLLSPFLAPPLSDKYITRDGILIKLKELFLITNNEDAHITRGAIFGMGGLGKTVIATAFANEKDVRKHFPDGILWATLGENPNLLQVLSTWGFALRDPDLIASGYTNEQLAVNRLRTLLREKACLLIVDDVWQLDHVKNSFLIGSSHCLLVITTRKRDIAEAMGAEIFQLPDMSESEALSLLANWSGYLNTATNPIALQLSKEVGYLPLALELIGARVAKLNSWEEYLKMWENEKFNALKRGRRSFSKEENLQYSFELSFQSLGDDQKYFLQLGVFPKGVFFSYSAVATLLDLPPNDALEFLIDMAEQAMLSKQQIDGKLYFKFHDLMYDFVVSKLGEVELVAAHNALLNKYWKQCKNGWASGPSDSYFLEQLAYHLIQASRQEELYHLLTDSPDWMETKSKEFGSDSSFLADIDRCLQLYSCTSKILKLYTVRHIVFDRVSSYGDSDIEILAWLKREKQALGQVRLRVDAKHKFNGLLIVYEVLANTNQTDLTLLEEARCVAQQILKPIDRVYALCTLALKYKLAIRDNWNKIFQEAEEIGRTISDAFIRSKALVHVAISRMQTDDLSALTLLIETLDTMPRIDDWNLFDQHKKDDILGDLALKLCKNHYHGKCLDVIERIQEGFERYETLLQVINFWFKNEEIPQPGLLRQLEHITSSASTYDRPSADCCMATFHALVGDTEACMSITRLIDNISKRSAAQYYLVWKFIKIDNCTKAEELRKDIVHPYWLARSTNLLIKYCRKPGILNPLINEANSAILLIEDIDSQFYVISELAVILSEMGELKESLKFIESIAYDYQRAKALIEIAPILCKNKNIQINEIIDTALEIGHGIKRDVWWIPEILRALALNLAKNGNNRANEVLVEAWELERTQKESSIGLLIQLALLFAKSDRIAAALQIVTSLKDNFDKTAAFRNLALLLYENKKSGVDAFLQDMKTTAKSVQNRDKQATALTELILILGTLGDGDLLETIDEAEAFAKNIPDDSWTFDQQGKSSGKALYNLVCTLLDINQIEKANNLADGIPSHYYRSLALSAVAWKLSPLEDARAKTIFQQSEQAALIKYKLNPGERADALTAIINRLISIGQFDEAIRVANIEFREEEHSVTRFDLIVSLCKAKRFNDALNIINDIKNLYWRGRAFIAVGVFMYKEDDSKAMDLFIKAKDIALNQLSNDQALLFYIALGFSEVPLIDEAIRIADIIQQNDWKVEANRRIALVLLKANDSRGNLYLNKANSLAKNEIDEKTREILYTNLAETSIQLGQWKEAVTWLDFLGIDAFLDKVVNWVANSETEDISLKALIEIVGVASWFRKDWRAIYEILSESMVQN